MEVIIRKWELSDAKSLAASIGNPNVQKNLRDGLPNPYTEQDGVEFITSMLATDGDATFSFAIVVDGKAVGCVSVYRQDNIHRQTAEMGYHLAEEYWGQGVMTQAVKETCRCVFAHSDILRIYAEPFARNAASCRVLEKAGFQYEGTLRSNAVKDGVVLDMKMYSILRPDEPQT